MDDGRLPKQVMHWEVNTIKRRMGRPKKNWIDTGKQDLNDIGKSAVLTAKTGFAVWHGVSLTRDEPTTKILGGPRSWHNFDIRVRVLVPGFEN